MVYLEPGYGPCAKNPDILEKRVEVDFKDGSRFSYNG